AAPAPAAGRIRTNPAAAAAPTIQRDSDARRVVRREYTSLGQQNTEYAEPKFDGKAPTEELPPPMEGNLEGGLDFLYDEAEKAAPEFKSKVNSLAALTGGKPQYRSDPNAAKAMEGMSDEDKKAQREKDNLDLTKGVGLKGRARAIEKANSDYGGSAAGLADILGATIEYDSFPNMGAGFKRCGQLGLEGVRQKNRILKPTAGGYRDIMMNVKLSNGHIAELQFNLTGMLKAKEKGHKQYEEVRTLEGSHKQTQLPLDPEELAKLKRLYD